MRFVCKFGYYFWTVPKTTFYTKIDIFLINDFGDIILWSK